MTETQAVLPDHHIRKQRIFNTMRAEFIFDPSEESLLLLMKHPVGRIPDIVSIIIKSRIEPRKTSCVDITPDEEHGAINSAVRSLDVGAIAEWCPYPGKALFDNSGAAVSF
jgi:hypothetical protein